MDDMHEHRRMGDTDDMTGRKLAAIAESTFGKLLNRFGVPLLLSVLGFYLVNERNDAKQANVRIEAAAGATGQRHLTDEVRRA
jgi:hypothetical protein